MLARTIVAVVLAWVLAWPAVAGMPQTPRPRQVTVADGLPSNRINGIAEDQNGYLWIATSDGLARYDGIGFRTWRAEQGLRDNFVWSVHVDSRNRVWVGTADAGLAVLDADRKQFRYYNRGNHKEIGSDTVWAITSTRDGAVWFGTSPGGLHRLDLDGRITRFMPVEGDPRSLPDAEVSHLLVAPDGTLWVGTKQGIARWTGHDFERAPAQALSSPLINGITAEYDGTLWFGTPRGVGVRYADGRYVATPWANSGMAQPIMHVLLRDRSGDYWFDVPQGLGREDAGTMRVVPLYSGTAQGLVRPSWVGAYEDREGGLWFASYSNGLWYLPANWRQFAVLTRRLDDPDSLANAHVRGIASASDGNVWLVGTGGVLDRLDPGSGRVQHVARDIGKGYVLYDVVEGRNGAVWVSYLGGLARVDPATGHVRRWDEHDADAPPSGESKLAFVGDGTLWLITEDGSLQMRNGDGRVLRRFHAGDGSGLPRELFIEQIARGPDGALWLAGTHGLWRWNAAVERFERVPGAPGVRAYAFAWRDGQVWIARLGELDRYGWDGTTLSPSQRIGARDELPVIAPGGLAIDAEGIVWASTVRGLMRVDADQRSVRLYGVRDGLPSQEFDGTPLIRPRDGRVLIGSPEGLVLFDPALVHPKVTGPTLTIESIDVRRRDARIGLEPDRAFEMEHDDRDLRIVARLLSFNDARNHVYRFRLEGYDTDWVEVDASGERIFSQLKPGQYRLRVSARTADNVWSPVRIIDFKVASPWWQTWEAIAGMIALLVLLAWWSADAYRIRLKRRHSWQLAQHEREIAKEASLAKTRFLATLGHEVRTPMTGVLGMSELLLDTPLDGQQRGYVESIRRAGRHLLRLVNDALDLARIESGKLELSDAPFDLRTVVDETAALMAPLARQRGLAFGIEMDAGAPRGLRGDANRLCQILLNLLGNAIKFTEHGSVRLRVSALSPEESGVRLEIVDTGPGLDEEQQARLFRRFEQAEGARTSARYGGSGLGLAICQELAMAMGGRIRVESAPGHGARFIVELPLPAAELPAEHDGSSSLLAARSAPLSLLLVEDDPTVADVIAGLLRAQGHRVVHAGHGLAALSEAATDTFDAAILDLDLPGMDGLALARQLRLQGFAAPLLAVTARADADAEPQAMAAGFQGFLRKPVTGAMLAGLLEGVPRRRQVREAIDVGGTEAG